MTNISFPGLGIGEFALPEVMLSFSESFKLYTSAVFVAVAMLVAALIAVFRIKKLGIKLDDVIDLTLFTVIFSVVGARLYYVLGSLDTIGSFGEVFAIWNGGLGFYGALLGGSLTIFVVSRVKKISALKLFDALIPSLLAAQFITAIGNFFNTSAIGSQVYEKDALYFLRMGISPHVFEDAGKTAYVHPTFLYEAIWLLVGFLVIFLLSRKKKFDGQSALAYLAWYGLGRTLIEGLELYSLKLGVFRLTQVVGFISFIVCTLLLIFNLAKAYRKKKDSEDYEPTYKKMSRPSSLFEKDENGDEDEDYTPSFNFGKSDDETNETSAASDADDGETEE